MILNLCHTVYGNKTIDIHGRKCSYISCTVECVNLVFSSESLIGVNGFNSYLYKTTASLNNNICLVIYKTFTNRKQQKHYFLYICKM
jgi:hypothetical protein